jgi:ornithine carbamoyltransferase
MEQTVNSLIVIVGHISNSIIGEAIIIGVAFLIVFRLAVSILFNYRTRLLGAIEETYQKHVDELKVMVSEKEEEAADCKTILKEMRIELGTLKKEMASLVAFVKVYACNNAPTCERRNPAVYDFCDGCADEVCTDCPFSTPNATILPE